MVHYTSRILLDEDVYEEMKLWQKGLVAMWNAEGNYDCIFIETFKNIDEQSHMFIECIPIPREQGTLIPIYFKVIFFLKKNNCNLQFFKKCLWY